MLEMILIFFDFAFLRGLVVLAMQRCTADQVGPRSLLAASYTVGQAGEHRIAYPCSWESI